MIAKIISRLATLKFLFDNRANFRAFVARVRSDKESLRRRPGLWHGPNIDHYTALVQGVPSDFAEIGCYKGDTFSKLIPIARRQDKSAHAFDSFEDIADSGSLDWRPKGQFAVIRCR